MNKTINNWRSFNRVGVQWGMVLALMLTLSACGFELRGTADLPTVMGRTYLDMPDRFGEFGRALERSLESNDIQIVNDPENATAVLQISQAQFVREAASFSGTALISEFRLTFRVRFQLLGEDSRPFSTNREVVLFRDYSFDSQEILASQREEEFLRGNLRNDMVNELVRRLEQLDS